MRQATVDAMCAYCHTSLGPAAAPCCPLCAAAHHEDCWDENVGCAVLGCAAGPGYEDQQHAVAATTAATIAATTTDDEGPATSDGTCTAAVVPSPRWTTTGDKDHDDVRADPLRRGQGSTAATAGSAGIRRRAMLAGLVLLVLALPVGTAFAVRADLLAPVLGHLHTQEALEASAEAARRAGHEDGRAEGDRAGRAAGRTAGLAEGRVQGRAEAESDVQAREAAEYSRGYDAGTAAAARPGSSAYQQAYDAGRDAALAQGTYEEGYAAGVASASSAGTYEGGYESGYDLGYLSGVNCAAYSAQPYTDCPPS